MQKRWIKLLERLWQTLQNTCVTCDFHSSAPPRESESASISKAALSSGSRSQPTLPVIGDIQVSKVPLPLGVPAQIRPFRACRSRCTSAGNGRSVNASHRLSFAFSSATTDVAHSSRMHISPASAGFTSLDIHLHQNYIALLRIDSQSTFDHPYMEPAQPSAQVLDAARRFLLERFPRIPRQNLDSLAWSVAKFARLHVAYYEQVTVLWLMENHPTCRRRYNQNLTQDWRWKIAQYPREHRGRKAAVFETCDHSSATSCALGHWMGQWERRQRRGRTESSATATNPKTPSERPTSCSICSRAFSRKPPQSRNTSSAPLM